MKRIPHLLTLLACLAGLSASAAEVPFGHAAWKASPTDPVGLAGQGRNWFPGATPPAEWADLTNGVTKNIRWKVPIPGWTEAQPLAVGQRIIGVYSPHYVVCYDAESGKVLWQDDLKLLTLPALSADRKSIGPVPEPVEAAKRQDLFERCLAVHRVMHAAGATYTHRYNPIAERVPLYEHIVEVLRQWRTHFEKAWPEAVKPLDEDLKLWALYRPGNEAEVKELTNDRRKTPSAFIGFAEQTTGISVFNNWPGSISDVMASPVSDGERVYVVLGFGQIAAYELASGKRLWAFRDPLLTPGTADHNAGPLLWKDLLLVPSPGELRRSETNRRGVWHRSIRAYDTRTGALRWESFEPRPSTGSAWGDRAWHGFHTPACLLRGPQGATYVVSGLGHVLDAETGQSVTQLTANAEIVHSGWGAGFIAATAEHLFKGNAVDNGTPLIELFPISWRERVPVFGPSVAGTFKPGQASFAVSDKVYVVPTGGMVEIATGKVLGQFPRGGLSATIAGQLVFVNHGLERNPTQNKTMGNIATLRTHVFGAGRAIENVIEAVGYTPDISHQYFPRFGTDPALRQWGAQYFGHANYQGIGFNFATDTSGLIAQGRRLYLHSPSWLYCIGEN